MGNEQIYPISKPLIAPPLCTEDPTGRAASAPDDKALPHRTPHLL
jgi:hypothetical protein